MIADRPDLLRTIAEQIHELADIEVAALIADLGALLTARLTTAQQTTLGDHVAGED